MQLVQSFQNCFKIPDLRRRILFTVGLWSSIASAVRSRSPASELVVLKEFFGNTGNTLFGLYDMFVGGALYPWDDLRFGHHALYQRLDYICSCWGAVIPYFQKLQREGEEGAKNHPVYTRYGTVFLAAAQSYGVSFFITGIKAPYSGQPAVSDPGLGLRWRPC